jgi:site-specific recombinase XerC
MPRDTLRSAGPYKAASRSDPRALPLRPLYGWSVVTTRDVVAFVADQRRGSLKVAAIADGGSGLSTRTVARRLSSLWGFYACLLAGGDAAVRSNPAPRGLATRRSRRSGGGGTLLMRTPGTLPRILSVEQVDALVAGVRGRRQGRSPADDPGG